jgi:hypothetical protein
MFCANSQGYVWNFLLTVQWEGSLAWTVSAAILNLTFWYLQNVCLYCIWPTLFADDLVAEKEKNKLLQEEMEATLHDIQNM